MYIGFYTDGEIQIAQQINQIIAGKGSGSNSTFSAIEIELGRVSFLPL